MKLAEHVIMVFVDGVGMGSDDPAVNPVHSGVCPVLEEMLLHAVRVDATLGVPGLPQSATGQATLLTGHNAARLVGRHVEGFPGPALRDLVREHNLFRQLADRGRTVTFANAYYLDDVRAVMEHRRQSVTTVMALSVEGTVRTMERLAVNDAVYQDLTREALRSRGYAGPLVTPEQSAEHLAAIGLRHHLALFEYFQTDRAGHTGVYAEARVVLGLLDRFLTVLRERLVGTGAYLLLTSDHGNVEDMTSRRHTLAPVPLVWEQDGRPVDRASVERIMDLTGVTPWLVDRMEGTGVAWVSKADR
ncbi:MAG: hypothetical protein A2340_13715 [Lentisphaerae bacterium RIFOXYB12_FULL_60_10]|nr:MAG: hypothetical protein A2340_13715 [Lentisphaerae bacterium RIFOXYB12_FULL_60_10]